MSLVTIRDWANNGRPFRFTHAGFGTVVSTHFALPTISSSGILLGVDMAAAFSSPIQSILGQVVLPDGTVLFADARKELLFESLSLSYRGQVPWAAEESWNFQCQTTVSAEIGITAWGFYLPGQAQTLI